MGNILLFENFLLEKSIGSENIRTKWYNDLPKRTYYALVNTDPTSVRKAEFSKNGKYTKWLIIQYKKGYLTQDMLSDKEFIKKLNYCLFIFSTGWYKCHFQYDADIMKYSSLQNFLSTLLPIMENYEEATNKSKYDMIYSDDNIDILIPLNFSTCFKYSKNTEWCTKEASGFSLWKSRAFLFRIIPKNKDYDKLKLTWRKNGEWYLACSVYPEFFEYKERKSPFTVEKGKEHWELSIEKSEYHCSHLPEVNQKVTQNGEVIKKTMSLVPNEAKRLIEEHYKKYTSDNI